MAESYSQATATTNDERDARAKALQDIFGDSSKERATGKADLALLVRDAES